MFSAYKDRVVQILSTGDLNVISAKKVRKQIESEFSIELSQEKKAFDSYVVELLNELPVIKQEPTVKKEIVKVEKKEKVDQGSLDLCSRTGCAISSHASRIRK